MSDRTKSQGYLHNNNVVFGTLVHEYDAVICAEQGIVVLHVPSTGKVYLLPGGVSIDSSAFGSEVGIIVRDVTDSVVLEKGPDDYTESELEDNPNILAIDSWDEVEKIIDETKLQELSRNSKSISTLISGIALTIAGAILWKKGFFIPLACLASILAGMSIAVFVGAIPLVKMIRRLNSDIMFDANDNWVNVKTGETSLNEGMRFAVESR